MRPGLQRPVEVAGLIEMAVFRRVAPRGDAAARIRHQERETMHVLKQPHRHAAAFGQPGELLQHPGIRVTGGGGPGLIERFIRDAQLLLETGDRRGHELMDLLPHQPAQPPPHLRRRAPHHHHRHACHTVGEREAMAHSAGIAAGGGGRGHPRGAVPNGGVLRFRGDGNDTPSAQSEERESEGREFHEIIWLRWLWREYGRRVCPRATSLARQPSAPGRKP